MHRSSHICGVFTAENVGVIGAMPSSSIESKLGAESACWSINISIGGISGLADETLHD